MLLSVFLSANFIALRYQHYTICFTICFTILLYDDDLPPLKLNDSEIKRVGKVKSLSVIVDEGLKWKNQFKSSTGKLAGLSSLKKLQNVLPQSKLCDVYRALFESHLRYVVWGSLSSTKLQTLQCLQNRALSIIESAKFKDPWPKK